MSGLFCATRVTPAMHTSHIRTIVGNPPFTLEASVDRRRRDIPDTELLEQLSKNLAILFLTPSVLFLPAIARAQTYNPDPLTAIQ